MLQQNIEAPVRNYVNRAVELYESEGLQATIDYYNSQDSLEGTLYLFLIGADDLYLAHPIFPHLIGTDIKEVVGSDGQELGKEIAEATDDGKWVEYLWPNPITRNEEHKTTWALRHDGLIFASGYYSAGDDPVDQPWVDADPRDYTVEYVENAIALYERDGLDAMLDFYNSVASFQGQWYLFATDEDDIYNVHPLVPILRGTDIKDVVGSNGYELGKEIAKATEEGHWIEYMWPHPATLKEVPKISYAVRRDGMIFASGYYPPQQDAEETAVDFVQQAIDKYEAEGLNAVVSYYNSDESIEGVFRLVVVDENDSGTGISAVRAPSRQKCPNTRSASRPHGLGDQHAEDHREWAMVQCRCGIRRWIPIWLDQQLLVNPPRRHHLPDRIQRVNQSQNTSMRSFRVKRLQLTRARGVLTYTSPTKEMARLAGFEPTTSAFAGLRSIH